MEIIPNWVAIILWVVLLIMMIIRFIESVESGKKIAMAITATAILFASTFLVLRVSKNFKESQQRLIHIINK